MRKKLIAGNWKMNNTSKEAVYLVKELKKNIKGKDKEILVCPAFTALGAVSKEAEGSDIKVGAQNMYFEEDGAFTGEVSPVMIKEFCNYVIIGHSERRQYFDEDNEMINKKVIVALKHSLIPIVCVGEKLEEREAGKAHDVVKNHITGALEGLSKKDVLKIILAYEPVWAIGTGKTATPKEAEDIHKYIRRLIQEMFDKDVAESLRILYGGSVKSSNASELLSKKDIDGALVGGASLDAEEFGKIIKNG
ncbi:MAG: triose-phosphate isomerase [Nanoarchaeota archaeon]